MNNQSIIVANDDDLYLDMMEQILEEDGYRRVRCVLVKHALDLLQRDVPDLLILDINPVNQDAGWRLLDRIRGDDLTRRIYVMICSTDPRLAHGRVSLLHDHRNDVIAKPFVMEDLLAKVRRVLGEPAR